MSYVGCLRKKVQIKKLKPVVNVISKIFTLDTAYSFVETYREKKGEKSGKGESGKKTRIEK